MKKFTYTLAITFCLTLGLQAKIITVSNLGGANYTNLTDAYNAAVDGDTIYIEATEINYGSITTNKKLTWVGIGFYPKMDDLRRSIVKHVTVDTGASGSRFYGLLVETLANPASKGALNNILVEDCQITEYIDFSHNPVTNVIVRNTIFTATSTHFSPYSIYMHDADSLADRSSILILNSYLTQSIEGYNNAYNLIEIDHCILNTNKSSTFTGSINNALLKNNVIYNSGVQGGSGNIFMNNYFRGSGSLGGTNSGTGNIFSSNPVFVNDGNFFTWNSSEDYHLVNGSLAIGAATDSTDIGIYGGNSTYSNSGEPLWLPIVRSLNFQGAPVPLVQPGDTLNITIEASRPQMD